MWVATSWLNGLNLSATCKALTSNIARMKGIPRKYTNGILNRLEGQKTRIHFDNFTSDLLNIDNGCDQGDPTSVILYQFYNGGLIDISKESNTELAPAFINEVMFLAGGKTFEITHTKIHSMMMRPSGDYKWSRQHNSFFKMDKLQLIDFSRKREKDPTKKRKIMPINEIAPGSK